MTTEQMIQLMCRCTTPTLYRVAGVAVAYCATCGGAVVPTPRTEQMTQKLFRTGQAKE